jgi:hypothetical protein
MFVWLRIMLLCFFRFVFNGIILVSWPGSWIWKISLGQLWFFFKAFFSNIFFCWYFFRLAIYGIISISCPRSRVWFVHLGWILGPLKTILYICFHHISRYTFLTLFWCIRPFIVFYSSKPWFFKVNLYFIYLNKIV